MAEITHPAVAQVHGIESWRGHPFLVVEYLAGGTFASLAAGGTGTGPDAVLITEVLVSEHREAVQTGSATNTGPGGELDLVMRQEDRAGEKLFVDYAGQTVPVVDCETGEERDAQVFVAVLGASIYTFAEATWTQTLPDWIASHVRAFEFFAGCPELVIPDNLRPGSTAPIAASQT